MKVTSWILSVFLILMNIGCANKVERLSKGGRELLFQFTVRGQLALNNPNITYYVVFYAPTDKAKTTLNATLTGPRVNGPNINLSTNDLAGRLPFTGLFPGDIASQWTHFFYIQGSSTGTPQVGYGQTTDDQASAQVTTLAQIVQPNYPATFWSKLSESTFQLRIPLQEIGLTDANIPNNIPANLAVSQNLTNANGGDGYVYDYWLNNTPFSISTEANNSPFVQPDNTPNIAFDPTEQLINRNLPALPLNVNQADLDFIEYQYRVLVP